MHAMYVTFAPPEAAVAAPGAQSASTLTLKHDTTSQRRRAFGTRTGTPFLPHDAIGTRPPGQTHPRPRDRPRMALAPTSGRSHVETTSAAHLHARALLRLPGGVSGRRCRPADRRFPNAGVPGGDRAPVGVPVAPAGDRWRSSKRASTANIPISRDGSSALVASVEAIRSSREPARHGGRRSDRAQLTATSRASRASRRTRGCSLRGRRSMLFSIASAIRWAADRHARVINLSLAGLGPVPGYEEAVDYALARGALVVAAAGNCFDGNFTRCTPPGAEQAPAWLPHVLTVGATAADGSPSRFSIPSARWVDLAAPGELVTTLWPTRNNPYSATPECPFVGTTGLLLDRRGLGGRVGPERDLVRDGDGLGRGRDPLRRRPRPPPRTGRVVAPANGSAGRRSATPGGGRNHRHRGGARARAPGVDSRGGLRRAKRPSCDRGANSVSRRPRDARLARRPRRRVPTDAATWRHARRPLGRTGRDASRLSHAAAPFRHLAGEGSATARADRAGTGCGSLRPSARARITA